jgi:DNA-binding CsgD family transcriptional regulator
VSSPAGTGRAVWQSLTAAERQVVRAVTAGRTNREAADVLFLSPHTVNSHLRHVYVKLGISSRTELVRLAVCHEDLGAGVQTAARPGR